MALVLTGMKSSAGAPPGVAVPDLGHGENGAGAIGASVVGSALGNVANEDVGSSLAGDAVFVLFAVLRDVGQTTSASIRRGQRRCSGRRGRLVGGEGWNSWITSAASSVRPSRMVFAAEAASLRSDTWSAVRSPTTGAYPMRRAAAKASTNCCATEKASMEEEALTAEGTRGSSLKD